jgi:hypothetical protein
VEMPVLYLSGLPDDPSQQYTEFNHIEYIAEGPIAYSLISFREGNCEGEY